MSSLTTGRFALALRQGCTACTSWSLSSGMWPLNGHCFSQKHFSAFPPQLLPDVCRADADLELLSKRKPPKNAFADKVVWITGASQVRCRLCCDEVPSRLHLGFQLWFLDLQGLGEELAKQFAAQGAYLILSSRNAARLEVF